MGSMEAITKSGKHAQGWQYATEKDIMEALRKSLVEKNIFVFTSSEITELVKLEKTDKNGNKKEEVIAAVKTTHTFADGDSGETFEVTSSGTGWDTTDKGAFKAITGAMKYFGMKNFFIESEDDPENVSGSVQNKKSFGSSVKVAPKPSLTPKKEEVPKVESVPGEQKPSPRKTFIRS